MPGREKAIAEKWRSAMTIPRDLELKETENGLRLSSNPVDELKKLRKPGQNFILMTEIFFPNENFDRVTFFQKNGKMKILNSALYELNPVWE